MKSLSNKVAIVAGASSGIGYATAKLFGEEGASVVVAAGRQVELNNLVDEIVEAGGQAIALAGDVKEEIFAKTLVDLACNSFGRLDIAFNNVGIYGAIGDTPNISLAGWQETIDVNLTSAFLGAKYQLPAIAERGSGSLIFTSSFVGHTVGFSGMASYAASKAGMIGLAQSLAVEFGPRGIRVNTLLPGGTNTPMYTSGYTTEEGRAGVRNLHALKRVAEPEEISRAALFLASDASSFMTGASMLVDGGVSISRT